jgi:hypothetical protein
MDRLIKPGNDDFAKPACPLSVVDALNPVVLDRSGRDRILSKP